MKSIRNNPNGSSFNKSKLLGTAGLFLTMLTPSVIAQEVQDAINGKKDVKDEGPEIILVTGIRSSLESALLTKRDASSIVDAISAEDIGSLPALDLGEALQAIPGVQVNREGERRSSEINLRGLPGGFVKVTANGQSFANPTRSSSAVGATNPFGAYEASVFDGVTVVKTPTADMQAGGIAGIIDKKLQRALGRPDGRYTVNIGSRYEQLNDSVDQDFAISGSQHLIKNELAFAFKVAGSEQNFRRDSILVRKYENLDSNLYPEIAQWKEDNGLSPDDVVRVPADIRQLTEGNSGDRISFSGNLEWKVTDDWKVGVDTLYTKRNLDDNKFEQVQAVAKVDASNPYEGVRITPTSKPFFVGTGDNGEQAYAVSQVDMENVSYLPGNRIFNMYEQSQGLFLYSEYTMDDWLLDGVVSYSEAENKFVQTGFDGRIQAERNKAPTGVNATLHTGEGNLDDFLFTVDNYENLDLDQQFGEGSSASYSVEAINDPRSVKFYVLGQEDNPRRDMASAEFNAKRYLDFDLLGDALTVRAIKFGARYSSEFLENRVFNNSAAGINRNNISNDFFIDNPISTSSTDYFNGKLPGGLQPLEGWQTLDTNYVNTLLQDGLVVPEGDQLVPASGFVMQTNRNTGENSQFSKNFDSTQDVYAAYVMADFAGELGSIPYTGNVGVRYVDTQNKIEGMSSFSTVAVNPETGENETLYGLAPELVENDYQYFLPSLNVSFELQENLLMRFAYSEGFVRPNIRFMTPSESYDETNTTVRINLPGSNVNPYEAQMYDFSLEWYNREGSAVSLGIFQKDIEGWFETRNLCPSNGSEFGLGELEKREIAGGGFECFEVELTDQGENREVFISEKYNSDLGLSVTGYELAMQQKLDFLPFPWNGFGGIFNYSYVDNDGDEGVSLPGVSENSYNLIGYWEGKGFSFRLSYNYRDEYTLEGNSSFSGLDERSVKPRGQLDFSARYKFNKHLAFSLRGYNLTDVLYEEYITDNDKVVSRTNYDGRTYAASIQYVF